MKKEDREVKISQTQALSLKIVFASIFMGASLLLDLYAMINYSKWIWLIAILSLVFVASVYFFSGSIIQLRLQAQKEKEELYNDLFKSSKATYLMMKKCFEEVQQQLDELEEKAGLPQEEIINAQKSIAKISINRSKENTDALMNSNDNLLEKVFQFEDQLNKIEDTIAAKQKASTTEAIQEVLLKQQELSNLLKEVEIALKKDILTVSSRIQSQPVMMTSSPMQDQSYMQPDMAMDHNEIPNDVLDDLIAKAGEELDRQAAGVDEMEEKPGEVISLDQDFQEEEPLFAGDEPTLEPDFPDEPVETVVDDIIADDSGFEPDFIDEPVVDIENDMVADAPLVEPMTEAEPEESVIQAEPEASQEPVQEEKPPMPDLSDPNHVMTPDEIAALLANM